MSTNTNCKRCGQEFKLPRKTRKFLKQNPGAEVKLLCPHCAGNTAQNNEKIEFEWPNLREIFGSMNFGGGVTENPIESILELLKGAGKLIAFPFLLLWQCGKFFVKYLPDLLGIIFNGIGAIIKLIAMLMEIPVLNIFVLVFIVGGITLLLQKFGFIELPGFVNSTFEFLFGLVKKT